MLSEIRWYKRSADVCERLRDSEKRELLGRKRAMDEGGGIENWVKLGNGKSNNYNYSGVKTYVRSGGMVKEK